MDWGRAHGLHAADGNRQCIQVKYDQHAQSHIPFDPFALALPFLLTGLGLGVSTWGGVGMCFKGSGMSTEMSLKGSCAVDV